LGCAVKAVARGAGAAKNVATICKNLKIAERTLVLEAAAEASVVGVNIGEIVKSTTHVNLVKIIPQTESEVLKSAIRQNKHVKMARDYLDKPAKELQKSIKSYEKQIAIHQEKIINPSQAIPHWDTLHPERRHALTNIKWPSEIQCYTEQKDLLQAILNERINHGK